MNHYKLIIDDDDRLCMILALGTAHGILTRRILELEPYEEIEMPTPGKFKEHQAVVGPGRAAAEAILSPPPVAPATVVLADRWIKKKPDAFETIEAPIVKIEDKTGANGPFLKVTRTNQGRGFAYASVFDSELFPFIRSRLQQRTTLYVVKSGKYINVVGVRA